MSASRLVWRCQFRRPQPAVQLPCYSRPIATTSTPNNKAVDPSSTLQSSDQPNTREIDSRWLSMIKLRVAKCMTFGLTRQQVRQAGDILRVIARDWRELTAGSEGFLTGETRRGLFRHNVVWGEMDVMSQQARCLSNYRNIPGHVNNVSYVRYAESARINWVRNLAVYIDPIHRKQWLEFIGSTAVGLILRSIKVDYKFPMTYPDKITVYHKLSQAPPSSSSPDCGSYSAFHLDVLILSESKQRPAARCYEDIVTYDYRLGRKAPLPPFMLDQFRHMWELQEQARRESSQRIEDIESRVRALEMGSWDREDAVENTGSAG